MYDFVLGDCFAQMKTMEDNSVDLILTDPPYNLADVAETIVISGREDLNKVGTWDKNFDPAFLLSEFKRILKPTGNLFAFTSFHLIGRWWEVFDPEFDVFQKVAWHKTNPAPHFRKVSFLNSIEDIICCWNKGHTWNFQRQVDMHNFLQTPICMGKERVKDAQGKSLHQTQKPLKVLRPLIYWGSNPGDVVYDPFSGVASVGCAALELGRRYIGVELDPGYHEAGLERLRKVEFGSKKDWIYRVEDYR